MVVWRKTPLRVNKGIQDVRFMVHYLSPCRNGTSHYDSPLSKRKMDVSRRFIDWCEEYTREMVERNLNLICSDEGTLNHTNPKFKQEFLQRYSLADAAEEDDRELSKHGDKKNGITTSKKPRRKSKTKKPKKRALTLIAIAIVAVVALAGTYIIGNAVSGNSDNIAEVAKQNLENTKKMSTEIEEVRKQVEDTFRQINLTVSIVEDLKDQVQALRMEANVMNQATVASIVTKYEQLGKNLREIAMDWQQGKLHPSFFTTLKFKDECGASCPIDLYKPLACNYNAQKQDIEIKMVRQVVRADVDIISADPFTYYDIKDRKQHGRSILGKVTPQFLRMHIEISRSQNLGYHQNWLPEDGKSKRAESDGRTDTNE